MAVNVSQSIHRMPTGFDIVPTLTPHTQTLLLCPPELEPPHGLQDAQDAQPHEQPELDVSSSSRPLFGLEMLRLQGLDISHLEEQIVQQFSDAQCADLAGNSFSSSAVQFALVVCLTIFGDLIPDSVESLEALRTAARAHHTGKAPAAPEASFMYPSKGGVFR